MKLPLSLLILIVAASPSLMGCEASTTVQTRIRMPAHASPSRENLHVRVLRAYRFNVPLELPGNRCPSYSEMKRKELTGSISRVKDGFQVTQTAIPSVPEFCLAAWYDANQNGIIDAGDSLGHLEVPFPRQPSRFFHSNRFHSPPVVLRPIR
ncbi:hypothetical protein KKF84_14010 [Myxococcota bacterium]|nr:hypothetical protein [Myxococcota bacterium]MBU1536437.1 hypothetical protein [Myxococcota bacterium]